MAKSKKPKSLVEALTPKERVFLLEYMVDYDMPRAVDAAGYSMKNPTLARGMAHKILNRPKVKALVELLEERRRQEFEIEAKDILWNLWAVATRDGKDYVDAQGRLIGSVVLQDGTIAEGKSINDLPDKVTAAIDGIEQKRKVITLEDGSVIEEIETKLRLSPKAAALRMAMEHKGLFAPEQTEVILKVDESMFRKPDADPFGIESKVSIIDHKP